MTDSAVYDGRACVASFTQLVVSLTREKQTIVISGSINGIVASKKILVRTNIIGSQRVVFVRRLNQYL